MKMKSLSPEQRISAWREFRSGLSNEINEGLKQILHFWQLQIPSSRYIDFYHCDDWPDPWELIHNHYFCINSLTLLMFYTIILKYKELDVCVHLVHDGNDRFLIVVVDRTYVLSFSLKEIMKWEDYSRNVLLLASFEKDKIKEVR